MAVKAQTESQGRRRSGRRREILGIVLLAFGLFAGISLAAMHAGNNQMMGPGGAAAAAGVYALVGVAGYLLIAGAIVAAWRSFSGQSLIDGFFEATGALMLLAAVTVLLHLPFSGGVHLSRGPGGLLGQWLGEVTASFIGSIGAALAATTLLFVALLLITEIQTKEIAVVVAWASARVRDALWMGLRALGRLAVAMFPERETPQTVKALASGRNGRDDQAFHQTAQAADNAYDDLDDDDHVNRRQLDAGVPSSLTGQDTDGVRIGHSRSHSDQGGNDVDDRRAAISAIVAEVAAVERVARHERQGALATDGDQDNLGFEADEADEADEPDEPAEALVISESPARAAMSGAADAPKAGDSDSEADSDSEGEGAGPIIVEPTWRTRMREREQARQDAKDGVKEEANAAKGPSFIRLGNGAYRLPSSDLLEYLPPQGNETDKQGLYEMAERLEQAMANYGVRGKVKEIHMGPVVTMFEFAPEPGTRTGKIANLEKDLAMALEAQAVRILAPIPGKSVVGVEVPNKTREMVYLREILEDDCFTSATSKLQIALGKDIKGAPVTVNLAKMPHLLVAGTTGSGKSVAVNGMIVSLLYNASPEDVRFIMVDPKMLELSIYEGIPHLLLPVVTDPNR
ncbi:MAG: DNA translocase FtsK 4TM domain-containing protein, partial [Deltaproteobacteria bacterium]|nr:DNA translocase FtsK 4TM domain-containing protein [Deltaproteobacteria bacterium]